MHLYIIVTVNTIIPYDTVRAEIEGDQMLPFLLLVYSIPFLSLGGNKKIFLIYSLFSSKY